MRIIRDFAVDMRIVDDLRAHRVISVYYIIVLQS